MTTVLDSSAVLALLRTEPGHDGVAELLPGSLISALNYSETVQKLAQLGSPTAEDDVAALIALGVTVAAFDTTRAIGAARLWQATCSVGLSLADRACLALAAEIPNGTAVTADSVWAKLDLDIPVQLIR